MWFFNVTTIVKLTIYLANLGGSHIIFFNVFLTRFKWFQNFCSIMSKEGRIDRNM